MRYTRDIPPAWRALAVLCYGAGLLGLDVLLPFAVWVVYRRSFFLRAHALTAGVIQGVGLVLLGLIQSANYLVILETESFIMPYGQVAGEILSKQFAFTAPLLAMMSLAFLALAMGVAGQAARSGGGRRRKRDGRRIAERGSLYALLAVVLTVFVINNEGIWGPPPVIPAGEGAAFGLDFIKKFQDPFQFFPGYPVTLLCVFLSCYAVQGDVLWFGSIRRLFVRLFREERAAGEKRWRAARLRAWLIPGWGHFFLGRRVSGIAAFCALALLLFYFVISFGLVYGTAVANVPGLNANFTWYFLSELGLRSQIPDASFKAIFGSPFMLAGIVLGIVLLFGYSRWSVGAVFFERKRAGLWIQTSPSLLLHLTPLAMFFVIPVAFQLARPAAPPREPVEPIPIIPEFFEKPKNKFDLNGGAYSGNEAEQYYPGPAGETPREGPEKTAPENRTAENRPGPHTKRQAPRVGGRPGKRADLTYSNYISAKIRGPQSDGYWEQVPDPYAAVFEYKISAAGRVYDVRVLEPSGHTRADELTVRVIETMGHLIPPPGEETIVVTELFWNTSYGDEELPTELQRNLSRAFDGRVIEPY